MYGRRHATPRRDACLQAPGAAAAAALVVALTLQLPSIAITTEQLLFLEVCDAMHLLGAEHVCFGRVKTMQQALRATSQAALLAARHQHGRK